MNTQARLFTYLERTRLVAAMLFVVLGFTTATALAQTRGVQIVKNESEQRVDVLVDGKPFTSYIWLKSLKTPTLYPLRTVHGTAVTRGFPLEARPGERVDHPHHVGYWLNYGNVNGVDFWNSSSALPPEQQARMGSIAHRRIIRATNGKERGELEVEMEWIMPDGQPVLRETTRFVFHAGSNLRAVDRITTLTALDKRVLFADNKEGMLGMRVRRELEQPSNEPLVFTDASGRATDVKVMDNTGVSGMYRSSEGKVGDAVWGTRGRWTLLSGKVDQEPVTLAILDHPKNPGFPTYWHARGYGLFAANPLGQEVFSNGKEKLNFTLEPKQSVTFNYRLLILSGSVSPEQVETEYSRFVQIK
ncbi:MAG: PmoA family protein [Pyrinomonadaceae bacterium]|nr:PmoA family protein [Pyrinomonadaceae bacterium]